MTKVTFTDDGIKVVMSDGKGAQFAAIAETAADLSESARDIAQAAVGVDYADATAALAGASNGDKFTYWDGDQIVYSTKTGGALVELAGPWLDADKIGYGASTVEEALNDIPISTQGTVDVNPNVALGGSPVAALAGAPTRATWDAIGGTAPSTSLHSLGLSSHQIGAANSAIITGGRAGYYSAVGADGALSLTYGGDNYNNHLAGHCVSMHCDMILTPGDDGVTLKGSHGAIIGGSYKILSGDYSGSFVGQRKHIYALQSVSLGGQGHVMGTAANSDAVRRSGILGGLNINVQNAFEAAIVGGLTNTIDGGDRAVILGGEGNTATGDMTLIASSLTCEATALRGTIISSVNGIADVENALVRTEGMFAFVGDNQHYHITGRRAFTAGGAGTSGAYQITLNGGSGVGLFAVPTNSICNAVFDVMVVNTARTIVGQYTVRAVVKRDAGTASILSQAVTTHYETDSAMEVPVVLAVSSTHMAIQVFAPAADTYRATAQGWVTSVKF